MAVPASGIAERRDNQATGAAWTNQADTGTMRRGQRVSNVANACRAAQLQIYILPILDSRWNERETEQEKH